jgi:hypothetical protein
MSQQRKRRTYYWDTGVIIPFFNASREPEDAKIAKHILEDAEREHVDIVIAMTLQQYSEQVPETRIVID